MSQVIATHLLTAGSAPAAAPSWLDLEFDARDKDEMPTAAVEYVIAPADYAKLGAALCHPVAEY